MTETDVILHNYPQSPVAEKFRVVLGIKSLTWRNVEIPRLPPKPLLTSLTGGYRRTPVMQIGADIYCDSQCILRELERRYPDPPIIPASDAGLLWCLSRWTDRALFDLSVKIVLGAAGDNLPADFAQDRGRLYLGENWSEGLKHTNIELPHLIAQVRAPLTWLEQQLSDGRAFLSGLRPAAIDAQMYHVVWFVHGRWDGGPVLIAQFPQVQQWMYNVKAIGHGQATDISPEDALATAASAEPVTISEVADHEPQGLVAGQHVSITPESMVVNKPLRESCGWLMQKQLRLIECQTRRATSAFISLVRAIAFTRKNEASVEAAVAILIPAYWQTSRPTSYRWPDLLWQCSFALKGVKSTSDFNVKTFLRGVAISVRHIIAMPLVNSQAI